LWLSPPREPRDEDRLRDPELDRFFEDFEEELREPLERPLRDCEPFWGILPFPPRVLTAFAYPAQQDRIAR
jgi:hypothetical protein